MAKFREVESLLGKLGAVASTMETSIATAVEAQTSGQKLSRDTLGLRSRFMPLEMSDITKRLDKLKQRLSAAA